VSLILDGSNGLSDVDGTAATPAIRGTDTNTGIFFPAADTIAFSEGGTESMRIDANGNVGIGTTSPAQKLNVSNSGSAYTLITNTGTGPSNLFLGAANAQTQIISRDGTTGAVPTVFLQGTTESMRIDSSGNLLVGTASALNGYSYSGAIHGLSTDAKQLNLRNSNATASRVWTLGMTNNSEFIIYANGSTGQYMNWNGTSWISSSDERFKTDLKPIKNAIDKVSQLRSVTGRYKTDEEDVSRAFLIAQDVQAVFPEAVDVRADEDKTLGLRYTEMIPLLVASIKELKAELDTVKAELATLKA
jgi:hypothetical protein